MLLQQVRQVLTAPPAIQSRPGTGGKTRHGSDGLPRTPKSQSLRSPEKTQPPQPQRRGLPAYVRRPGGPDLRRHGPRGGEAGVRTVQAVHGGARRPGRDGAARVPIGRGAATGREEEEEDRMQRGGVFVFIAAPRFLFSVRWQLATPFFGKISAEPCARHDGLPLLRGCPPVGFMNEPPCRPGHLQDTPSTYFAILCITGFTRHTPQYGLVPASFLEALQSSCWIPFFVLLLLPYRNC